MARSRRGSENRRPTTKGQKKLKRKEKASSKGNKKARATRKPAKTATGLLNYRLMKALSHEQRVRIFAILTERTASPNELAKELDEGLSQVSYHVKVLKDYGFIELGKTEPRRGAVEHFYQAVKPTLIPVGAWDNLPPAARRSVSVSILNEFFADASESLKAGLFDADPGLVGWTPLILDSQGLKEVTQLALDFQEAVGDVQNMATKRLPKANDKPPKGATSATVFLASFLSARSPQEEKKASAAKLR